jgi:hypothetical protein
MFEATLEPEKHSAVAEVLKHIVGIDSVDDEGAAEVNIHTTAGLKDSRKRQRNILFLVAFNLRMCHGLINFSHRLCL